MVEYALILANSAQLSFTNLVQGIIDWLPQPSWGLVGYGIFALVALRVAFWAFKTPG